MGHGPLRLLLDTHALIWAWNGSKELSDTAREAIRNPDNRAFVSPISAFEISTKFHFGKLPAAEALVRDFGSLIDKYRMELLDLRGDHGLRAGSYSKAHRDPFDRLLAAQAELDDAHLVTRDREFAHFPCRTLW